MARPLFLLGAQPAGKATARRFFDAAPGSVVDLLRSPPSTRENGWDMRTLDEPRFVDGSYLEVGQPDYKQVRVYRDGTVVFRGVGDGDLLGWGRREVDAFLKRPRLNPLVITELVYHFAQFVGEVTKRFDVVPDSYQMTCGLRRAQLTSGEMLYVTPFELDTSGWTFEMEKYPAQSVDFDADMTVAVADLRADPNKVAAALLAEFYVRFGMPTDRLPYVQTQDDGVRKVIVPLGDG